MKQGTIAKHKSSVNTTNYMKANTTSKKGMPDGQEYVVQVYAPTLDEWLAHFTKDTSRLASDYNQHKIANNLASKLKAAFETPTEKTRAETVTANAELVRKLKAGEVFDLRDFVNAEPRAKGDSDPIVKLIRDKWATSEKKAAFLHKFGLADVCTLDSTTEEVLAAYRAQDSAL